MTDTKLEDSIKYFSSNRLQNVVKSLSKCKTDFLNEVNESKRLREINMKLEVDLKEARELERSHRVQLSTSREMIGSLQETVSQLVYLKRDVRKLKDEILSKDTVISNLEKEKENLRKKHNDIVIDIKHQHEKHLEEIITNNDKKIEQMQQDSDTQLAQFSCVIEELRSKMKEMEEEHSDKINVVVLEYEEKMQRALSQVGDLQEQLARQASRADSNIEAYRRRLEELEEKLKQNQFKHYLAQSTPSMYESHVERPYSERDQYETNSLDLDPALQVSKLRITPTQSKPRNTLQVTYEGRSSNPPKTGNKKGPFIITKKRKLYNEKGFQDF